MGSGVHFMDIEWECFGSRRMVWPQERLPLGIPEWKRMKHQQVYHIEELKIPFQLLEPWSLAPPEFSVFHSCCEW